MKLLLICTFAVFSASAFADVTKIVNWKPKAGVSVDKVKESVRSLNAKAKGTPGLIKKETFYVSSTNSWFDVVVWKDSESEANFDKAQSQDEDLKKYSEVIDFSSVNSEVITVVE